MGHKKHNKTSSKQSKRNRVDLQPIPLAPCPRITQWSIALFIAAAAIVAHGASRNCGYVNWDDKDYISRNKLVTGDGGLRAIWTDLADKDSHQQYYPLTFTSLWIEYRLFGDEPRVFHTTQVALHAINAVLVFFVLRWLGFHTIACACAALLFAVHPINVASVAWLAERKNTLSGIFLWLSLLFYIQFRRKAGVWRYVAAFAAFQLGLFAKTALIVLAPILIVTDRLLDKRWTLASLKRATPFFLLSMVMTLITSGVESRISRSGEPLDILLRPLVAAAATCHYLVTMVLPFDLLPIYQRWPESIAEPRYWFCTAVVVGTAACLFRFRKRINPFAMWGIALFVLAVFPTLGFVHFNFLQYAFVSDHFVYIACVGIFAIVGVILNWMASRTKRVVPIALLCVIVAACSYLSIRQCGVWQNPTTFWKHTLAGNPDLFAGHFNLARHYARHNQHELALSCYREAARTNPNHANTRRLAAEECIRLGLQSEALWFYQDAVAVLKRTGRSPAAAQLEMADYLLRLGRNAEAAAAYREVLRLRPNDRRAQFGLTKTSQAAS